MSQPTEFHAAKPRKPTLQNLHIEHERLMDCIHCGLCLSQCPTYAENGIEADSPRGRIYLMRALYENRIEPTNDVVQHLDACLGCRACETACPSGVQYGYLIEGTRAHLREIGVKKSTKDTLILKAAENTFPYPKRLELLLLPVRALRRTGILPLLRKIGVMKRLGQIGDLEMLLPPLPDFKRRHRFVDKHAALEPKQASVGMLVGCVMPVMLPQVNEATARVLTRVGCEVAAPKTQGCCGAMHAHTGAMKTAKKLAQSNIEAFENWETQNGTLDAIIVNAAGCGSALKEYPHWFEGDGEWENRAQRFAERVRDVSEWLAEPRFKTRLAQQMGIVNSNAPEPRIERDVARETIPNTAGAATLRGGDSQSGADQIEAQSTDKLVDETPDVSTKEGSSTKEPLSTNTSSSTKETLPTKELSSTKAHAAKRVITYHDACHLSHGQGIRVAPRELLALLPNAQIVALGESEMCCGSAGTYNITQPAMANDLLKRKMKNVAQTGATVCVTGNPGCAMQLMLGAGKFGPRVEIRHPIELLDEALK